MMSKTHLTVGVAASLAVCMPTSIEGVFSAVIGGSIGAILCDIECKSTPNMRDALYGRIIAAGITGSILIADFFLHSGLIDSILSRDKLLLIMGAVLLLVVCIVGRLSEHRTFTHSLLYVLLITAGCFLIIPQLLIPVLIGGLSHLLIDTFNKKPVPWLYPFRKKGICLNICYASKVGNSILMWIGLIASVALLVWRVVVIVS